MRFFVKIQFDVHNRGMATDRHQAPSYPLRMPEELKAAVAKAAQISGRSLHAELLHRIQSSLDPGRGDDPVGRIEETLQYMVKRQEAKDNSLAMIRHILAENLLEIVEHLPASSPLRSRHKAGIAMARAVATPGAPGLEDVLVSLVGGEKGIVLAEGIADFVRETDIDFRPESERKPRKPKP